MRNFFRTKTTAFTVLVIGIAVSLCVLISVIIYSYICTKNLFADFKWVQHTYLVQSKLENITTLVSETESAKRGFLITGQKEFLNLYQGYRKEITHEIVLLEELKKNDQPQIEKILALENLILQRLQSIDSLIAMKLKDEKLYSEKYIAIINQGKFFMHQIRILNQQINSEEDRLLKERERLAYKDLYITEMAIFISGFLSLVIICLVIFIFKKDIDRKNQIAKELRALDAQKNKFFSIISHDLRNPVNGVKQLLTFLKSDNLPEEELKVIIKMIDESILKVSNLLEDLLKWGKLQMNKIEFKVEQFDLSLLVDESLNTLQQTAVLKNITISSKVPNATMVQADKNMVQTVVRNLLSNSIKFTMRGGTIDLYISLKPGFIKLFIKDNGIGMSEDTMSKLFRIDVAQSLTGTDNETGTGLGLILCKEFVEKNGGKIELSSILDKGTTIAVTFPNA